MIAPLAAVDTATTVRDVVLGTAALIGACTTILLALWWLLAPRVKAWFTDLIETRLAEPLNRVEQQVTPNGTSTTAERDVTTADRLVAIERKQSSHGQRIDALNLVLAGVMTDRHTDKLIWRRVLAAHGIEVPLSPTELTDDL